MIIQRDKKGRITAIHHDDGSDIHVEGKDLPAIIDAIGRYENESKKINKEIIIGVAHEILDGANVLIENMNSTTETEININEDDFK